jgi:superfamily I DNA/RNA helicase
MSQLELLEFHTASPAYPLFCHQEFLEKLAQHRQDAIGKRTSLLLQRMAVDPQRLHYKATQGVNRGWRRSRLGGGHGSHFYAWWAPRNAAPLENGYGFTAAPDGSLFLRDIRHHDDHSPLSAQTLEEHYLPVSVHDLRREEYGPAPWTPPQARFASARQTVRLLKGHPGSGKTTALWHAADNTGLQRVLYVTYSRDLAALARAYFDRYCSAEKHFQVVTFNQLVRHILNITDPVSSEYEARKRFSKDLAAFSRMLGPWSDQVTGLYDELHAHLVGDAMPIAAGRFAACTQARLPDKVYREKRTRFVGPQGAASAIEIANRLERNGRGTLAERYMPELDFGWQAADLLRRFALNEPGVLLATEWLNFDCLAVDECQDLTPVEASILVQLATLMNRERRSTVSVLIAGDEAQTVRPTDFEWGWLSDMLHARVGTPVEFKLSANLRSPRRIAELVNRVWDLYSQVQKQERPSGSSQAEIEEDASDHILYCTAVPGPELDELLTVLAAREGMALISLDDALPAVIPESLRPSVLTVSEAKGLDFHSVCVIDAGCQLERILRTDARWRSDADIEGMRKRLAIDRLRVALSRPTERLLWLDINSNDRQVRQSLEFLNGVTTEGSIGPAIPAAVLKQLEEEQLDVEERLQRCQDDARQYLSIRPEVAWSRAQQAVTLLGRPGTPAAVLDRAARNAAYLTLCEICFCLAFRGTQLAPELGRPNLFDEAQQAASRAERDGLAAVIAAIREVEADSAPPARLAALATLAQVLPNTREQVEPWLMVEIEPSKDDWTMELETAMHNGRNALVLSRILPPFFEALGIPDAKERTRTLQQRAVVVLLKDKQHEAALALLRELPERQPKLEAACYEAMGQFREAADAYRVIGSLKEALQCYRAIPDLEAARALIREMGDHPAAESLEWIAKLQGVVAERPEKFTKVVTAAEKKLLEELLERSLGVARKKPAPRKTTAKKTAAKKAAEPRKRVVRKVPF